MTTGTDLPPQPVPGLTLIVAASANDVIGVDGDLPWRLSADLKRFKQLTMGHPIIMGRKTFASLGRLLPGRETVIVTRNSNYRFDGAHIAHSIPGALAIATGIDPDRSFLIGGAEIYAAGLPWVAEIELTRVHVQLAGDTQLPEVDWSAWDLVDREDHQRDSRNEHAYSFLRYRRRSASEGSPALSGTPVVGG